MAVQGGSYALHWFRRDLRVAGNKALLEQQKDYNGRVLGIFCFDKKFLARHDFSHNRFLFFLRSLEALREELRALGGDLLFCDTGPDEAFQKVFHDLKAKGRPLPQSVSWNRDYEPYAIARDQRLQAWFHTQGVHTTNERDHILIEPHEIVKKTKPIGPYQIFTPYSKKWREAFATPEVSARIKEQKQGLTHLRKYRKGEVERMFRLRWKDALGEDERSWAIFQHYVVASEKKADIALPPVGSLGVLKQLEAFKPHLQSYEAARDIPEMDGTSHFSRYFKNGSLTTSQVIAAYDLNGEGALSEGAAKFLAEMMWREFGYYILAKHPRVENEAFDERFKGIPWINNEKWFEAWKEGRTGYPIVDAGMRQLNQTGWMHNRIRMIVASFLTKDLHINWQWGERYFMEKLIDGDLALNNMGWQWAASTGCDAQPYFRIFNPSLQSKRFDPDAIYIKRFVPELSPVAPKAIHALDVSKYRGRYPAPLVDHDKERQVALKHYGVRAKNKG